MQLAARTDRVDIEVAQRAVKMEFVMPLASSSQTAAVMAASDAQAAAALEELATLQI